MFVALATGLALCPQAGASLPAGGLDIFWDHWVHVLDHERWHGRPAITYEPGPWRFSGYLMAIGGIKNNTGGTASATGFSLAGEGYLLGPVTVAASGGQADSTSLKWAEIDVRGRLLLSPIFSVSLGAISATYTYKTNTGASNLSENRSQGPVLGASLFGSPWPAWFVQLDLDLVGLKGRQNDGTQTSVGSGVDALITLAGGVALTSLVDLTLFLRLVPNLGDQRSTSTQPAGGISITF